jgi:hypothetical protein
MIKPSVLVHRFTAHCHCSCSLVYHLPSAILLLRLRSAASSSKPSFTPTGGTTACRGRGRCLVARSSPPPLPKKNLRWKTLHASCSGDSETSSPAHFPSAVPYPSPPQSPSASFFWPLYVAEDESNGVVHYISQGLVRESLGHR